MNYTQPLKGVNLGGWLVLERWMTPAVFKGTDAVDEYTLSQTAEGRGAIKKHRDTFIQESDFVWLRDNGIDAIRLPIGYWIFESSDSLVPQVRYVDWAMKMAHAYNIKVIIDLHGLKGSQNGYDHSGKVGKSEWFKHATYRDDTLHVLAAIAERYKDDPQLWGIQIINEPKFGLLHFKLRSFYKKAYRVLEGILRPETHIIYSDGFTPRTLSGALGHSAQDGQIVMDVHLYHGTKFWTKFTTLEQYYRSLYHQTKLLKHLSKTQPVIVGEWSGTLRQSVFDSFPVAEHSALVKEHSKRQIESFKYTAGWFYWSYKTEQPGVWHFRSQVEAGIIKL